MLFNEKTLDRLWCRNAKYSLAYVFKLHYMNYSMVTKFLAEALWELAAWVVKPCLRTTASFSNRLKNPDE